MKERLPVPSIAEIKERLTPLFEDEGLQLVLLFGSALTRNMHKRSDVDLAFLYDKPVDVITLTNRVIRLLHRDTVDVVDLRSANPLLRFSVAQKGRPLYEKSPGVFHEFCSLAFRRYVDSKKLRDGQAKVIKDFLETRGQR
jgi:predicted nucleotidyltransferase